ncbi:MAG: glycosyltransferase [Planctomycetaceae bacterium]|nr:MAG: glycosyltransferase [Planctomycetaceae bacterium]
MIWIFLALFGLLCASVPAGMFVRNLGCFLPPPNPVDGSEESVDGLPRVALLIPARDEESSIAAAVQTGLASRGVELEVIVLDDHSTDRTAAIVRELAALNARVRLISGRELPAGWNGKQFACHQLAAAANHERLVFVDADVRLVPDAIARLVAYQDRSQADLLSAFPRQLTGTWLESWLIPMMHYILLGFLPISRMRRSRDPAFAAGCGQLFVTRAAAYRTAGTHESIKGSRHDGLKLPAAYRRAGLSTDIVDGTPIASCRMYRGAGQVARGLLKNASEGIASPRLILPFSILLLGANLVPWVALVGAVLSGVWLAAAIALLAIVVAHLPRALAAHRFRQPWFGVACHTPAVVTFIALQWVACFNALLGRQVAWRGRV